MTLRSLPSVDTLAARLSTDAAWGSPPRMVVTEVARAAIDEARRRIEAGESADAQAIAVAEISRLGRIRHQRVINATGVLLHTNLGRAPVAGAAADAARRAATGYEPLEFDLAAGGRGRRGDYVRHLLTTLTGAEAALVVNNNAGALFLALAALSQGGRVAVSRGELIEIGGSFRLPELMAASGAVLVEVGTTNRTRIADYEAVASDATVLLKVHPSNYRVEGFAEAASYQDLAVLARSSGALLAADIGSGLLDEQVPWMPGPPPEWIAGEPGAVQTLAAGADIVMFSGDKLLGGPQAGIVLGTEHAVHAMANHPIARAMRCDGTTLAALAETLHLYADGRGSEIPFWAMASIEYGELQSRVDQLLAISGVAGSIERGFSLPGAGSVPGMRLASPVLRIDEDAQATWRRLLAFDVPIVCRRDEGAVVIDLRAVDPADDGTVAAALKAACR